MINHRNHENDNDILVLIARRAGGDRLNRAEQATLERAMLSDPDLALLLLDATEVAAAPVRPQTIGDGRAATRGRVRLAALVMGLAACFGVGATAGAQLATGLLTSGVGAGPPSHNQPLTNVEFRGVGDALNLKLRIESREK